MKNLRAEFIKAGGTLIAIRTIERLDLSTIESGYVTIHHGAIATEATGPDAIEAVMTLKPSALEGRRLKWDKNRWALHNLVGHPMMQAFAFLRCYKAAIWVHDATVPAPRMPIPKGPGVK